MVEDLARGSLLGHSQAQKNWMTEEVVTMGVGQPCYNGQRNRCVDSPKDLTSGSAGADHPVAGSIGHRR